MTLLKVENLNVNYYGSSFSVKNLNFVLEKGERIVVYGREGCGKTTVLRAIAKLEEYQSGDIYVDGKPSKNYSQRELDFGYTFDSGALSKNEKVSDVISYPMRLREVSQCVIDEYLSAVSSNYDLPLDSKVIELTQEQIAFLIIARLFCVERRLYLVDDVWKDLEPTQMRKVVEAVKQNIVGKSALIAVSDKNVFDILDIDSVIVLSEGNATERSSYQILALHPPNMESAIFCEYELHIGLLDKDAGGHFALIGDGRFSVAKPISDVFVGKKVCFAIDEKSNKNCADIAVKEFYFDLQSERIISVGENEQ